jgi:hypothetical protein
MRKMIERAYSGGRAVTPISTITLREAAVRLAELHVTRDKVAHGRLLSLLRSGEIDAGIQFAVDAQTYWLEIPAAYWVQMSSDKMRIISQSRDRRGSGALKLRLGEFPEQVAATVTHVHGHQLDNKAWAPVLAACAKSFEVVISQSSWDGYIAKIPQPAVSSGPGSGRREKAGWRPALVITGAYIIKHFRETKEKIKPKEAADVIYKLCQDEGIAELPASATIADELAKILEKANSISIK